MLARAFFRHSIRLAPVLDAVEPGEPVRDRPQTLFPPARANYMVVL